MPFPVEERFVAAAESKLGVTFPRAYRSWLLGSNGGEVEIAHEGWFLHPVLDDSERERFRRTWDDVVRQTEHARAWDGFPSAAVSIADNGCGDRLVLLRGPTRDSTWTLYCWHHEDGEVEAVPGGVEAVFAGG